MRKSVKDYMREIEKQYKDATACVAADYEKITKLEEERVKIRGSRELTKEGKDNRISKINDEIKALNADIYALRADANEKAKGIRKEVEDRFFNYFHPDAGDVDMKLVTLINSGVLSDTEMLKMSETANLTMKRLLGKALENNGQFVTEGKALQIVSDNPHLRAIDGIIGLGDYACGGAYLSGASAAGTYLKKWDELATPMIDTAPNVSWCMDELAPGNGVSYTKE